MYLTCQFSLFLLAPANSMFYKGFSLSLILFMKWVISTISTIIFVPKLQPRVSDYIESDFINNVGLAQQYSLLHFL